ncbi:TatD family hydrolase [bacterium]|nr:TatD family hydrolase [bacterium]
MERFFDVHTHINMIKSPEDEVVAAAKAAGVEKVINIGTGPDDFQTVLKLAEKFYPFVVCTLGVHPHEGSVWDQSVQDFIKKEASQNTKVVAVGEIGLDYYYNNSPKKEQLEAFDQQMALAQELGLPVEIHTRDAEDDTKDILKSYQGKVRGLLHCFTGTWDLAKSALDCGFDISVSGVVTFKKAEELRETVSKIPLDRIHVETDAPFLAPMPHRGQENQPAFVQHTALKVAELLGVSLKVLSEKTQTNALDLFPRMNLS